MSEDWKAKVVRTSLLAERDHLIAERDDWKARAEKAEEQVRAYRDEQKARVARAASKGQGQ